MLLIEHKADFLYREDAYEDYSWYLDHGAQRPGANLYLCFENFRNLCLDNDLQLLDLSSQSFQARNEREKTNLPYQFSGLVKRILNVADAREVQKYLYEGKNVLALFPLAFYIHANYSHEVEKLEKTLHEPFQAFSLLDVDMQKQINLRDLDSISNMPVSLKGNVWWQEIPTTEQGRLVVSIDGHLSNYAFYINTHYASGFLREYQQALKLLIKEFSQFKYPLMRIDIRPDTMTWPSHEPLNLIVEITNHGPAVNELEMVMNLPDSFEPVGTIERTIPQLRRFAKTSFTLPVIPRVDGLFQNVITATARSSERDVISLIFSPTSIKVMLNVETNLRPQARQDDLGLSALQSTFRLLSGFPEIRNLPSLVVVDPHACLNKMRIIAEKLTTMVLTKQKIPPTKDFNAAIQTLQRSHLLSNRAIGYLHTTRTIGNLASHPSSETLSEMDVRIVSYALASVAEEINRKKLI